MNILPLPLETITNWIEHKERFALARFGDGEFQCIREQSGENCDGVTYSPALAMALETALFNPRIVHCVSGNGARYADDKWLWQRIPAIAWYDSAQVLDASAAGALWPLRRAIYRGHMLYVGPERLRIAVQEGLGAYDLVEVPLTTAFDEIDALIRAVALKIEQDDYRLVGISAGPAAKVLVDRLERSFPRVTIIDFGSVWDMYAGVPTRSGPKRLTTQQVDALALSNFHWTRPAATAVMEAPTLHDLLAIPGLIKEAEGAFLYRMALESKPGLTVELGTFRGRTAAILARAARETGSRVISIDNYSYPHAPEPGEPAQRLARFGLTAEFRQADSRIAPADVGEVAFLYVDSEHTEAHLSVELPAWLPKVAPGGLVVFHDYGKGTHTDVTRAVDREMGKRYWTELGRERSMIAFQRGAA
jgi:cephalosporin hydroxylase